MTSYDLAAVQALDDHLDELPCEFWLGGPVGVLIVLGLEEPEEERQADRPPARARQRHDEHDLHPAVAPAGASARPLWLGAVVEVVRAVYVLAGATEEAVVYGEADRRVACQQHRDEQLHEPQPELVGRPAAVGEEGVRAAVMPHPGQPGALQHPGDGVLADAGDEPDRQHAERLERGCGEARREQGKQTRKRTGNLIHVRHGGDLPVEGPRERSLRPAARWVYTHRIRGRRQPSSGRAQPTLTRRSTSQTHPPGADHTSHHYTALRPRKPRNSRYSKRCTKRYSKRYTGSERVLSAVEFDQCRQPGGQANEREQHAADCNGISGAALAHLEAAGHHVADLNPRVEE